MIKYFTSHKQIESEFLQYYSDEIHKNQYNEILKKLLKQKKDSLQNYLIIGKRGMGKSSLLKRLQIETKNNKELNSKINTVYMGSENISINRLFKLWIEILAALDPKSVELIQNYKKSNIDDYTYQLFVNCIKESNKTLLLLIDNFDLLINKLNKQEIQKLRETLTTLPVQIIGNSLYFDEKFFDYKAPFYDFFKSIKLQNLNIDESYNLLKKYSKDEKEFEKLFNEKQAKFRALYTITGGVPRTLLIIYSIIFKEDYREGFDYLNRTIDEVTPLYQDRLKAISDDQQTIIKAIATIFEKCQVKDINKIAMLPPTSLSAQLVYLEKIGYIKSEIIKDLKRNKLYFIDEYFFAIWILYSESSLYDQNRVKWLTHWLEIFYEKNELMFLHSRIIGDESINLDIKYNVHHATIASTCLNETDRKEMSIKVKNLLNIENPIEEETTLVFENIEDREKLYLDEIAKGDVDAMFNLALLYHNEYKDFVMAEKYYLMAIKNENTKAMNNLALVYENEHKDILKAERYYLMAIEKGDANAMFNLALLYEDENKDFKNAERYYLMAIEKGITSAMNNLALLYHYEYKDFVKAEKYYLMSIEKRHTKAMNNLAILYEKEHKDFVKAEKYYLIAIKNGVAEAIFNLAILYEKENKDFKKAEKYYLMAIENGDVNSIFNLALLYESEYIDFKKAEKYYHMGIEKGHIDAINNLALLYFSNIEFKNKKEDALNLVHEDSNVKVLILLWNNLYKEAYLSAKKIIDKDEFNALVLDYFLVFNQRRYLLKLFNEFDSLKDQNLVCYYLLMDELKEEFPKEKDKMPEMLEEVFKEYKDKIKKLREEYGTV